VRGRREIGGVRALTRDAGVGEAASQRTEDSMEDVLNMPETDEGMSGGGEVRGE